MTSNSTICSNNISTNQMNSSSVVSNIIKFKERSNAISDTSSYGQLWVKDSTPNELYFTTDAGDDIQLTSGTIIAGAVRTVSNGVDNRIATFSSDSALNGESNLTFDGNLLTVAGTNPQIRIGDDGAEDTSLVFMGNAQDYYIALDDTTDDLTIGTGTTIGSNVKMSIASSGTVSMNSNLITNVSNPSSNQDVATKSYVDSVATGLDLKESCRVATTANGALSTAFENGDTIDNVSLVTGNRILIKDQSTASENGIYIVNASGAPTRSTDLSAGTDASGTFTFIEEGDVNGDKGFVCSTNSGSAVVGTNNLTFTQFSAKGIVSAVNNGADNRIATFSSSDALNGEANLTFDGSLLTVQDSDIAIQANSADANDLQLIFQKSRHATDGSHTIVQDNDKLGSIEWYGSDGTDYAPAASIFSRVNGTPGDNDMPTELVFATTADGANSVTERMTINSSGNVGIGMTSPEAKLTVEGTIKLKEQADADADTTAYGQLWVNTATPNELYFTTDAGDDIQITSGTSIAGGGGVSGNTFATDLKIGRDSDNNIDFSTDNRMIFTVDGFEHLKIRGDSWPQGEITIGGSNKDGSIFVGPNGNRTLFLGNARHSNANTSIAGKSGIYFQYELVTISNSSVPDADDYILGYIKYTADGANTWTLPTGAALQNAIDDVLDSPYTSSRHFVEGYSFTTYVIIDTDGTSPITYAAGASGCTLNSVTGNLVQANNTIARLDFIFTGMSSGSEEYHCLLHCTN